MIHKIKVNNVTCDGCVNTIETELKKIDGVDNVHFDKSSLTVKVKGTTTREILTKTLLGLGYPEKN